MVPSDLRVGLRVRTRYGNGVVDNEPIDNTERWLVKLDGHERDGDKWLWFAPAELAPLPDDTRLIAQLVVGRRVHCVGDESVMALAKRVLELEVECAAKHAIAAEEATRRARVEADLAEEREACAHICDRMGAWHVADLVRKRGKE